MGCQAYHQYPKKSELTGTSIPNALSLLCLEQS